MVLLLAIHKVGWVFLSQKIHEEFTESPILRTGILRFKAQALSPLLLFETQVLNVKNIYLTERKKKK